MSGIEESPLRDLLRLAGGRLRVFEVSLPDGTAATKQTVADFQEKTGARVACVRRGNEWLLPLPGTDLKAGDLLTLFAGAGDVEKVLRHLQARKSPSRGQ